MAAFAPSPPAFPPIPSIWPDAPMEPEARIALYRAASRARFLKAASHAAGSRAATAAAEAQRVAEETIEECTFWRYAYEQRTGEAQALRTALATLLATLPTPLD